jgi:signal transduction histidine kinase
VKLGIPEMIAAAPLPRRLAWLTGVRLLFLTLSLTLVGMFYLRGKYDLGSFTTHVALATLGFSFLFAGIYAGLLRIGRHLEQLADAQLVLDQLTWTVVVYLTGGATSGATSFYGLSCLVGATLTGLRGSLLAASAGAVLYSALVLLLQQQILPTPADQPPALYQLSSSELTFYVLVNLLVLLVVTLLAGTLAERLRWTGGELVAATQRADQAERMAALGRLAAGLAHEIRNPLGSIAGSIQLLRTASALGEEDRQLCDIIQREASRLNDLVSDMMDLSKPREPVFRVVDAVAIAKDVVELATKSGRAVSDVSVRFEGPTHAPVWADGAQLRQLVWNLVRNAVQASKPGGVVRTVIEVKGAVVELRVSDQGVGIDDASKERIFDAFFTTRSQGTGMGLAVVKRIADEHGFSIKVQSSAGRGATFHVQLGRQRSLDSVNPPA